MPAPSESSGNITASLLEPRKPSVYRPQSALWRTWHCACYSTGGFLFPLGSLCYFPSIDCFVAGGWLFTIGSAGFLLADATEWWYFRLGCVLDRSVRAAWEDEVITPAFDDLPKTTLKGRLLRAEVGLNFFLSIIGSALYFTGSVGFIPSLDILSAGCWQFIFGSAIIVVAQSWKVYRSGCSAEDKRDHTFRLINFLNEPWGALVDAFAGLGGACYFVGTVLFLPTVDTGVLEQTVAATWFVMGGTGFCLSACCMILRYFFVKGMPWNS